MRHQPQVFRINIGDDAIEDLRYRLDRARWPDQVNDEQWSWGADREYFRELTDYWRHQFDWRGAESRINAFDQYLLDIDGLGMHYIHQRSPHVDALPLIITHGWPGSIVEFLGLIPRLTEPERFGGRAEDAWHVVAPSLPGFGCSPASRLPGMHPGRIAERHARLMANLGYERYVAQGGDWGSMVSQWTSHCDPEHCRAIHLNAFQQIPPQDLPDPMSVVREHERAWLEGGMRHKTEGMGYYHQQSTRPQTLAYGLNDSPLGLCAWIGEKFHFWTDHNGDLRDAVSWDGSVSV